MISQLVVKPLLEFRYYCKVLMIFYGTITIGWNGLGQPWFFNGFGVWQPLVMMVYDGCPLLVQRWKGYLTSSKSIQHTSHCVAPKFLGFICHLHKSDNLVKKYIQPSYTGLSAYHHCKSSLQSLNHFEKGNKMLSQMDCSTLVLKVDGIGMGLDWVEISRWGEV